MHFVRLTQAYIQRDIMDLCDRLNFGPVLEIWELQGCASHRVFKVLAGSHILMIKQLSPAMMKKPNELEYHINSQRIAHGFAQRGISTILAFSSAPGNSVMRIRNHCYMVYTWDVTAENAKQISSEMCLRVGQILRELHYRLPRFETDIPIREENYQTYSLAHWKVCLRAFSRSNNPLWDIFTFMVIYRGAWRSYRKLMNTKKVISHCDLTPNNILWKDATPIIIDWDAAGYISQEKDLIQTIIAWCEAEGRIIPERVAHFAEGYGVNSSFRIHDYGCAYRSVFMEDIELVQMLADRGADLDSIYCEIKKVCLRWKMKSKNISVINDVFAK